MTRWLRRLGAVCAAHPLVVIAVWVAVAAGVTAASLSVGGRYSQGESLPGTEVQAGEGQLQTHAPALANVSAQLLLHARSGNPETLRAGLAKVEAAAAGLPHVVRASLHDVTFSRDGGAAILSLRYDVPRFVLHRGDLKAAQRAASAAQRQGVDGFVTGQLFYDLNLPSSGLGEKVGIGVAVLVLLVAFGSVIAALMPVATAALAIVTGLGLVRLLAAVYAVNDSGPQLATMIGLGVGIDYALFIVTRHREGMRAGLEPPAAAAAATATAGSSVMWAGVTVVAAICGLAFAGIPIITSLGFASAIVVAVSAVSALTLLPALLSLTDKHIDYLHVPLPHLRHERVGARLDPSVPVQQTWWSGWARRIERRPVRYLASSLVLLAVLAVPVSGIRLGMPDGSSASRGSDWYRSYTLMAHDFGPGANAPVTLVVAMPPGRRVQTVDRVVRTAVERDRGVASTGHLVPSPDGAIGVLQVIPATGPQAAATTALIPRLRNQDLPAVEAAFGRHIWVVGIVAGRYDVAQRVLDRLPWFVGAVLALSFLLLMLVFRSVLVPLKAVLLNLLSIAAALGVVTAVFCWGWLRQAVGLPETVPIVDVVPMMMFAIVFGLSMDYEVFLLSRVREEWVLGGDSRGSVVRGLTSTARVITAAAAIMVCVFLAFTLASDAVVKMMGLGLAVAVALDATVIRLVLVPATMSLLGDWNWWLPRWLDRLLPHVDVEGAVPVTPYAPVPGPAQETEAPIARPMP